LPWFEFESGIFLLFTPICSCGELPLLVSWCIGDICDMVGSDEDLSKSRRHSAEDRGWSSTCRLLSGWTIRRSDDAVCILYHAQGDEDRVFLGSASKPRSMVSPGLALKPVATILVVWP
jgi:hypothetical protein